MKVIVNGLSKSKLKFMCWPHLVYKRKHYRSYNLTLDKFCNLPSLTHWAIHTLNLGKTRLGRFHFFFNELLFTYVSEWDLVS